MTDRHYFECSACKVHIITRTAIGHGKYQAFVFPCPGCGIELKFGMRIFPERIPKNPELGGKLPILWEYTDFKNTVEIGQDESAPYTLSFDPENVVSLKAKHGQKVQLTPWMESMTLVADFAEYDEIRKMRLGAINDFGEPLERATTYLLNGNQSALVSSLREIRPEVSADANERYILIRLMESFKLFGALFAPEFVSHRKQTEEAVTQACSKHEGEIEKLIAHYKQHERANNLLLQLRNIARQWSDLYPMLSALDIIPFLRDKSFSLLEHYTVAQKRFGELKALYIDCFETAGRLSVVAAAIDGINATGTLCVQGAKKNLAIEAFEEMANGSKPDILCNLKNAALFLPAFDHTLRNGIGHHAAHYSTKDDMIYYQNHSKARGIESFSIRYGELCKKTADIARLVDGLSFYGYWLWVNCRGFKWRKV